MLRIAELRKARGMSQTALARQLNITSQAVTAWETGRSMPAAATLPKLAVALGCTIDDLFVKEAKDDGREDPARAAV